MLAWNALDAITFMEAPTGLLQGLTSIFQLGRAMQAATMTAEAPTRTMAGATPAPATTPVSPHLYRTLCSGSSPLTALLSACMSRCSR